jgi:adenylate cyclase
VVTACAAFGLVVALYVPMRWLVQRGFLQLEDAEARRALGRARRAVGDDLATVSATTRDYAVWDDIWRFADPDAQGVSDFAARNITEATFSVNRLDLFALRAADGRLWFHQAFDRRTMQPISLPAEDAARIAAIPSGGGLVNSSRGPLMVGVHPVLRSTGEGPQHGELLLGRILDDAEVARLAKAHAVEMSISPLTAAAVAAGSARPPDQASPEVSVQPLSDDALSVSSALRDAHGVDFLSLQLRLPREILHEGKESVRWLLWALILAGVGFGAAVSILIERLVTARLARLSQDVSRVAQNPDHSLRVRAQGQDELGVLADDINAMLSSLEALNLQLDAERDRSDQLLLNILPPDIADRLKSGQRVIADSFAEASILFADIVGFTSLAERVSPSELVSMLSDIFTLFDALARRHGVEKIKTIGDAYMAVCGIPIPRPDHAPALFRMALDMLDAIRSFNRARGAHLSIRIGINSGPVIAGVIGTQKFIYDLWGDAVNVASRMESHGEPGCVHLTDATFQGLSPPPLALGRTILIKGKGAMLTWLIRPESAVAQSEGDDRDDFEHVEAAPDAERAEAFAPAPPASLDPSGVLS